MKKLLLLLLVPITAFAASQNYAVVDMDIQTGKYQ